jgi:hypothetical protein
MSVDGTTMQVLAVIFVATLIEALIGVPRDQELRRNKE